VSTPRTRADATPHKRRYSVAVMGDSLSDPRSKGGRYLDYLREKCPRSRFDSWAKGGNMVNQMRKRFAHDVFGDGAGPDEEPRPAYTHVLILGGIADIGSNMSAGRTVSMIEDDLTLMYRIARAHGAKVIALTLPPWGGFKDYTDEHEVMMTEVNAWIRKVPPGADFVLDVYPLLSCGNPRTLCAKYAVSDKLHWNSAAHEVVGAALHAQLFADCE
jgi:hypothetical protein